MSKQQQTNQTSKKTAQNKKIDSLNDQCSSLQLGTNQAHIKQGFGDKLKSEKDSESKFEEHLQQTKMSTEILNSFEDLYQCVQRYSLDMNKSAQNTVEQPILEGEEKIKFSSEFEEITVKFQKHKTKLFEFSQQLNKVEGQNDFLKLSQQTFDSEKKQLLIDIENQKNNSSKMVDSVKSIIANLQQQIKDLQSTNTSLNDKLKKSEQFYREEVERKQKFQEEKISGIQKERELQNQYYEQKIQTKDHKIAQLEKFIEDKKKTIQNLEKENLILENLSSLKNQEKNSKNLKEVKEIQEQKAEIQNKRDKQENQFDKLIRETGQENLLKVIAQKLKIDSTIDLFRFAKTMGVEDEINSILAPYNLTFPNSFEAFEEKIKERNTFDHFSRNLILDKERDVNDFNVSGDKNDSLYNYFEAFKKLHYELQEEKVQEFIERKNLNK